MQSLGEFGAGFLVPILRMAFLIGACVVADKISARILPRTVESERRGCLLTLVIAALILLVAFLLFEPALRVLERYSCRHAGDYDLCMNPEIGDWM
jgi:hypothetical protein